ncbi:MAG: DEAD/DEAH box helicase [Succinivibrio sp.]|nr:DEAD/DEAH box helicase [Succinivibrio sp.]
MSDNNDKDTAMAVSTGADDSLLLAEADNGGEELLTFKDMNLDKRVLKAVSALGFESPTPIQMQSIPVMLDGEDMLGQAQTGTGKTAAFSLPVLSRIDPEQPGIQALILEPTRELALQVSEAITKFAKFIDDFRVVPIYGGASYDNQIRALRHGAQVVVGTPGRLIDLIERGKVQLDSVRFLVIDEADEMLRMGFIDDVDWILSNTPDDRQTALFSATMPPAIARIAREHLMNPTEIRIESKTTTATTVHQRYWVASGFHKIDAMTRLLEVEPYDAVLVFVRTKTDAEDVANKLMARGLACAALHGDIPQRQREKIIERLKSGSLDIIVATDVAARGLDVDRITHVINYDIPYDAESYVHRIGRTGRAGRTGEAILFVSPRERHALRSIERVTRQKIEPMVMPTAADVNKVRLENFKNEILETIEQGELEEYEQVVSDLLTDDSLEPEILAAALAKMAQKGGALLLDDSKPEPAQRIFEEGDGRERRSRDRGEHHDRADRPRRTPSAQPQPLREFPDMKMIRFRVAVGRRDGAKPGQIVGAIANEGNIESKYIGEISIFDTFSTVDLPDGMPAETKDILASALVCGRPLELREYTAEPPHGRREGGRGRERDYDRQGMQSHRDLGDSRRKREGKRRSNSERPAFSFQDRDRRHSSGSRGSRRREGF